MEQSRWAQARRCADPHVAQLNVTVKRQGNCMPGIDCSSGIEHGGEALPTIAGCTRHQA
jgi:hypothetical protein